jgi:hypothetical protein
MPIGPGLIGAAILIVGLFALGRLVGWWLGRSEEMTPRQRSVYQKLAFLVPLLIMWATPILFRVYPIGHSLLSSGPTWAGALLNSIIATTVAAIGLTGALWGLRPFTNARPMVRGELFRRRRLARAYIVGLVLFTALLIEFGILYSSSLTGLLFAVLLISPVGLFLSLIVGVPIACPSMRFGVRPPTDEEYDRLDRIYERLDIQSPDGIEITVDEYVSRVVVLRTDDKRVVALSDSLLSAFDDDMLSVGIAHAEGRARHRVDALKKPHMWNVLAALVLVIWVIGAVLIVPGVPIVALGGALLLVSLVVVVSWVIGAWGRERIHLADEDMIRHVNVDSSVVTDIYMNPDKRLGVVSTEIREKADGIYEYLTVEPSIEERLVAMGLAGSGRGEPSKPREVESEVNE